MGRHAFRGMVTAWMALIVLRTVGTAGGSGKVASLFADADRLVTRALSPDVPAIPDRRTAGSSTPEQVYNMTPAQLQGVINATTAANALAPVTAPGGLLGSGLQQYSTGGGLSAAIANNPALR